MHHPNPRGNPKTGRVLIHPFPLPHPQILRGEQGALSSDRRRGSSLQLKESRAGLDFWDHQSHQDPAVPLLCSDSEMSQRPSDRGDKPISPLPGTTRDLPRNRGAVAARNFIHEAKKNPPWQPSSPRGPINAPRLGSPGRCSELEPAPSSSHERQNCR